MPHTHGEKGEPVVLSVCMIVRDSARTLADCIASVRPWADELVVVDTGSQDHTREIARGFGARLFEFPWIDDFSAARNESLRHARGEWLFWLDSDDTMDAANGRRLRELVYGDHPQNVLGYVIQVQCPVVTSAGAKDVSVVDHVKLIRNDPRIRFEGRIHEQVIPAIRRLAGDVAWTELFVVHSGADYSTEGRQRKIERDLRILQLDLQDRPNHPFVLFNLGMTYEDIGQHAEAETWLRQCLQFSSPGDSYVRKAYALLVGSLDQQGRADDAGQICRAGLSMFPDDTELMFRLGHLEQRAGRLTAARDSYAALFRIKTPRRLSSIDRGIAGYKARHNLALVHEDEGNFTLAELQWRFSLESMPQHAPARRGLGLALLRQRKIAACKVLLKQFDSDPAARADALWLHALAREFVGQTSGIRELIEEALAVDSHHLPAQQDYCRWLFHHGTLQETEQALRRLLELSPNNAPTLHNLGLVLARMSRPREAIEAFEQSLAIRPNHAPTQHELERLLRGSASTERYQT